MCITCVSCMLTAAMTYRIDDLATICGSEGERHVWVQGEGFAHRFAWGKIGETLKLNELLDRHLINTQAAIAYLSRQ